MVPRIGISIAGVLFLLGMIAIVTGIAAGVIGIVVRAVRNRSIRGPAMLAASVLGAFFCLVAAVVFVVVLRYYSLEQAPSITARVMEDVTSSGRRRIPPSFTRPRGPAVIDRFGRQRAPLEQVDPPSTSGGDAPARGDELEEGQPTGGETELLPSPRAPAQTPAQTPAESWQFGGPAMVITEPIRQVHAFGMLSVTWIVLVLAVAAVLACIMLAAVSAWRWVGGILALVVGLGFLSIVGSQNSARRQTAHEQARRELAQASQLDYEATAARELLDNRSRTGLNEPSEEQGDGVDAANPVASPLEASVEASESSSVPTTSGTTTSGDVAQEGDTRPEWVNQPSRRQRNLFFTTATAGPYDTVGECEDEIASVQQRVISRYLERIVGGAGGQIEPLPEEIEERVVGERYVERVDTSMGPMFKLHSQLVFDDKARAELVDWWRESMAQQRLMLTGALAGLLLSWLGIAFGYLKLDALSGTKYRGRLKLAATAAVAVSIFAGLEITREMSAYF